MAVKVPLRAKAFPPTSSEPVSIANLLTTSFDPGVNASATIPGATVFSVVSLPMMGVPEPGLAFIVIVLIPNPLSVPADFVVGLPVVASIKVTETDSPAADAPGPEMVTPVLVPFSHGLPTAVMTDAKQLTVPRHDIAPIAIEGSAERKRDFFCFIWDPPQKLEWICITRCGGLASAATQLIWLPITSLRPPPTVGIVKAYAQHLEGFYLSYRGRSMKFFRLCARNCKGLSFH